MTVLLAPQPTAATGGADALEPGVPETTQAVRRPVAIATPRLRTTLPETVEPPARAAPQPLLPQVPDPVYYGARELDAYPRPVAPLDLGRLAAGDPGPVTLVLLIDVQGVVREVSFGGPAAPGRPDEELRALFEATPFVPARKDGRAVRSRVRISIRFAAGG